MNRGLFYLFFLLFLSIKVIVVLLEQPITHEELKDITNSLNRVMVKSFMASIGRVFTSSHLEQSS
jgi:hypothetical protein